MIGYGSEGPDRDRSFSTDSTGFKHKCGKRVLNSQLTNEETSLSWIPESVATTVITEPVNKNGCSNEDNDQKPANAQSDNLLAIPTTVIATSNSLDTLTESTLSGPSSPSNLSSVTLVGSTGSGGQDKSETNLAGTGDDSKEHKYGVAPSGPLPERIPLAPASQKNGDIPKEGIITYALPPTVTTTHYCETRTPASSTKVIFDDASTTINNKTRTSSIAAIGLQPHGKFLMDRRPSAGANIIPHAALCQHRHSLQLNNGDTGGLIKVS